MAWLSALPQTVVTLGIEEPLLVKAVLLKQVIHIGGEYEVVLIRYDKYVQIYTELHIFTL